MQLFVTPFFNFLQPPTLSTLDPKDLSRPCCHLPRARRDHAENDRFVNSARPSGAKPILGTPPLKLFPSTGSFIIIPLAAGMPGAVMAKTSGTEAYPVHDERTPPPSTPAAPSLPSKIGVTQPPPSILRQLAVHWEKDLNLFPTLALCVPMFLIFLGLSLFLEAYVLSNASSFLGIFFVGSYGKHRTGSSRMHTTCGATRVLAERALVWPAIGGSGLLVVLCRRPLHGEAVDLVRQHSRRQEVLRAVQPHQVRRAARLHAVGRRDALQCVLARPLEHAPHPRARRAVRHPRRRLDAPREPHGHLHQNSSPVRRALYGSQPRGRL